MKANEDLAGENTKTFKENKILSVNLMSSPGAGKTTILEETIKKLNAEIKMAVIEGDLMTSKDAERIHAQGAPVVQVNTEGGCHLDANMVSKALQEFDLEALDVVFIENVGNLVCPANFAMGEDKKVAVLSVPEGDDKPLKYPVMFKEVDVCVLNKIDFLPYSNFNMESFRRDVKSLNPQIKIIEMSASQGTGLDEWCDWIRGEVQWKKEQK